MTSFRYSLGLQIRHLLTIFVLFILFNVLLHFILHPVIVWIAVAALSVFLTDILMKFVLEIIPLPKISDLNNKAVLITGCGSGFGYELARRLDAKGVTVYAGYRRVTCPAASRLKEACSKKLVLLQMDVTKDDEVSDVYNKISQDLGTKSLQAVVNNAGVIWPGQIDFTPMSSYQKTMAVNGFGAINVTQTFLPLLKQSKGRVIFTEGICSYLGIPYLAPYSLSRHVGKAYLESLRREMLKWGITVHIVEPFLYRTAIADVEVLFQNLLNDWNQASEEVKASYGGDNYLTQIKKFITLFLSMGKPNSKVDEVAICLEDAAIGRLPKSRYVPGFTGKLMTWLGLFVPTELLDVLCAAIEKFFVFKGVQRISQRGS